MSDWSGLTITDGTDRDKRYSPALEPGYFDVDELRFDQLLAIGADYASAINFFDLNNEIDGTWSDMFHADEAVIMSLIQSTDLARLESEFLNLSSETPDKLASFMLELAYRINFWFTRLNTSVHESGKALAGKLAKIIDEKLAVELHNVGVIASHVLEPDAAITAGLSRFGSVWRLAEGEGNIRFPAATVADRGNTEALKQQLRSSFYIFFNSISYLKTITPALLQQSVGSQQHDPAVGLFIVFLKLYERAQQRLNTFTQRHLDFYYHDILKAKKREQVPERVYLLLETQAGTGKRKALIEKNTRFTAGKDEQLKEIVYRATEDMVVTDARVESLATLYLQHDELISPESELGYVTRIKSNVPQLPETQLSQDNMVPWPLFGIETHRSGRGVSADARMGFAVASPLLQLKEGVRDIDIAVELASRSGIDVDGLVSGLQKSHTAREFSRLFGRLFARYLLTSNGCLTEQDKDQIIAQAEQLLPANLAREIGLLLRQDWQGLFYRLFKKVFCIRLTVEGGWLDVEDYIVEPVSENPGQEKTGLRIVMVLGNDVAPITPYSAGRHDGEFDTDLPVFQCLINPHTNFYPYSIFQDLVINSLQLNVDVKGVKDVLAYNQHGQLDPTRPFQPFGPLPTTNSYLIFGNYEIARKGLTDLHVNLEWADLPDVSGGFAEYYRGYGTKFSNGIFRGKFSALSDNGWQPRDSTARPDMRLFRTAERGASLLNTRKIAVNVLDYSKPIDMSITEDEYQYGLGTRSGFYRLSLSGPPAAFGHAEYPQLLTKVLSANIRLKKTEQPPNPPYTPTLNKISLDYKASSTIYPAVKRYDAGVLSEKIIHQHPFGIEVVYPEVHDKPCFLMPQYRHAGNLFIGIAAGDLVDSLSLFFHIAEGAVHDVNSEEVPVEWFYLASNSWRAFPASRILSDTTNGFVSPGIVTLRVPSDINRDNSVMPGQYYWLRVSCAHLSGAICSVYDVKTNVLEAARRIDETTSAARGLPEPAKWSLLVPVAGVGNIIQAGKAFGGRAEEADIELKTRLSERLRHKNRALAPWDYERIVLERFPEVYKVKCFPNLSSSQESAMPGNVLIVVVPNAQSETDGSCARVRMTSDQIDQIRLHIKATVSPFARIEVINAVYEQVQVRCTVKFASGASDGINVNRLNQEISDYICPWKKQGYAVRFGWSIRQKDIESYIRGLSYVEFVTGFSMLHITRDSHGDYTLFDTARDVTGHEAVIRPHYPWSMAVPAKRHSVKTVQTARSIKAAITGVNELEVGSTLIISGNSCHGEEE